MLRVVAPQLSRLVLVLVDNLRQESSPQGITKHAVQLASSHKSCLQVGRM